MKYFTQMICPKTIVPQNALVYHQCPHLSECKSKNFWTEPNIYIYYNIELPGFLLILYVFVLTMHVYIYTYMYITIDIT